MKRLVIGLIVGSWLYTAGIVVSLEKIDFVLDQLPALTALLGQ